MKYENTFSILKEVVKNIENPMRVMEKGFENSSGFNKVVNALEKVNSALADPNSEKSYYNKKKNLSMTKENNKEDYSMDSFGIEEYEEQYNNSISNNNKANTVGENIKKCNSTEQGLIDSITQEITPVRLQQAIILSEIVGKPRSKTRKRRRF